ncbi:MAG TPA: diacylglycerol kinase family protein [Flavipsychrobacter sp.]|nr:diacylglycerol kinase family protein [Flavipsychrobacter sp.]
MHRARLIHNPNAGDGKYTNDELISLLQDKGYTITYANAKKGGWDYWDEDDDIIIVAGGDGTVRKLVKKLVRRQLIDKRFPIAVLPLGTANNIASTLYANKEVPAVIAQWSEPHTRAMDIARVRGIEEENFFMEGLGIGVFPKLMKEMKEQDDSEDENAKEELRTAQQLFAEIVSNYKPRFCHLMIDGEDFSGSYVLIEIMNMQAVGPNLELAPRANPSDGLLDVVLVRAEEQEKLAKYALLRSQGKEASYQFQTVQGKDIRMQWSGSLIHVDDQLLRVEKNTTVHIQLEPGLLLFYIDGDNLPQTVS